MSAYLHHTTIVPDEPRVRLNPGDASHRPLAVVELSADGFADITMHDIAEALALRDVFARAAGLLGHEPEGGA
jgi:hypothetical protein